MIDHVVIGAVDAGRKMPRWTFDEVHEAMQLRGALCTDQEIGEYLGRTAIAVRAKLRQETAAIRRLDAVHGRYVSEAVTPLRKVHMDALAGAAETHAAGSVHALCRILIDRLASRPDVVEQLMRVGR